LLAALRPVWGRQGGIPAQAQDPGGAAPTRARGLRRGSGRARSPFALQSARLAAVSWTAGRVCAWEPPGVDVGCAPRGETLAFALPRARVRVHPLRLGLWVLPEIDAAPKAGKILEVLSFSLPSSPFAGEDS